MKLEHFVTLFSVGFSEGILLSALSDLAFEVFVSKSFTGYLSLFVAVVALIMSFWLIPKFLLGESSIFNIRIMLVGIGFASFVRLLFTFIICTKVTQEGWGLFIFYQGPPYFSIIGVPYTTILWSLFLGSFFTTLERVLKVIEDYRNEKLTK
jgi:hypothetical protein